MLCHSFMATNRGSDVSAVDWLSQTPEKLSQLFMCGMVFISGGNPYKALQFISKTA